MTPHNEGKKGSIAKKVLMSGDPLRAKFISENYLTNVTNFNKVRNMLGYTGIYKGEKISVMGHGMGIPSIGIYAYELYKFYDVETIIRIGSCGSLQDNIHVKDIIIAMAASTNSNFVNQFNLPGTFAPIADFNLLEKAVNIGRKMNKNIHVGNVITSDTFYREDFSFNDAFRKMNVLGIEMETAGLYTLAASLNKKALSILTVSDHLYLEENTTSKERETSFTDMVEIALNI